MSGAPEKAVCFGLSPGQLTTPSEPACEPLVPAMLSGAILAAHDVSERSSLCPPRRKRRLQPLPPRSKRRLQPLPRVFKILLASVGVASRWLYASWSDSVPRAYVE